MKEELAENSLAGIRRAEGLLQVSPEEERRKEGYSILGNILLRNIPKVDIRNLGTVLRNLYKQPNKWVLPPTVFVNNIRGWVTTRLIVLATVVLTLAQRICDKRKE